MGKGFTNFFLINHNSAIVIILIAQINMALKIKPNNNKSNR